ncbi:acyl-CoA thioesterase II [Edhazardia aedis USNM 41457]|uniref:Acyl-CoA thioesterase II n=1 Tax=Edhazardia aedis (strain USNM 41457) TaxID=1003232 RepID=J9D0J2_EDHAE|nr:acyl-CoA thioesterase II [Edhazardia aedis USNM 41457]|eukprot:EJW01411.1 acyl-CoA thioesterase II [Edhazardia aedis USNM 41457]
MKFFDVENIEDKYRSVTQWNPFPSFPVYGGQILSQSIKVAYKNVQPDFHVHSTNIYFLIPASVDEKIVFETKIIRQGTGFMCQRVEAFQQDKLISTMDISFTKYGKEGLVFQSDDIKLDKNVKYDDIEGVIREGFKRFCTMPDDFKEKHLNETVQHIKYISDSIKIEIGKPNNNKRSIRFTLKESLDTEEDTACFISFISDFLLLEPALIVLNENLFGGNINTMSSINHSLYFHSVANGTVFVYNVECLRIVGNRVFCVGHLLNQNGELVATATQEGLIRLKISSLKV